MMHDNYYGISEQSIMDTRTVCDIAQLSGIHFDPVETSEANLKGCAAAVRCTERIIDTPKAVAYFEKELGDVTRLNTRVQGLGVISDGEVDVQGVNLDLIDPASGALVTERFGHCVDCSYGHLLGSQVTPIYFEPCLTLIYKSSATAKGETPRFFGRTVVTGPFLSIMPFWLHQGELRYNLTSVKDTPLGRFETRAQVDAFLAEFRQDDQALARKRQCFEEAARVYLADFDSLEYESYWLSTKTKFRSSTADRESIVDELMAGRVMQVFGGKISGIFAAAERVNKWLGIGTGDSEALSALRAAPFGGAGSVLCGEGH